MSNNNGRAREGSGPGLTGLSDFALDLVRMAEAVAGMEAETGAGYDSPGVALRASDQPGGGACPECERSNGPHYRGRCVHGGPVLVARELSVQALAAAADDAAALAEAFGRDAAFVVGSRVASGWRVKRVARIAFRCAEECRRLRALADAVQAADEDDQSCPACGAVQDCTRDCPERAWRMGGDR